MQNLFTLIMAGGKGTRLWPYSTQDRPKQYLKINSDRTLLEETLARFDGLVPLEQRYVVTTAEQELMVLESSKKLFASQGHTILEPQGRNTAPCILLSLYELLHRGASSQDVVAIMPSDHVILNVKGFQHTLQKSIAMAVEEERIVTIGIPPHKPHTGYGYIERAKSLGHGFEVSSFREKPNLETATSYLQSGNYFWNAGMFMAKIEVLLAEFERCAPEIFEHWESLKDASSHYKNIPAISIDYAVMEKSDRVAVVPAEFDWNDLGSWDALQEIYPEQENVVLAAQECKALQSQGNIIFAPGMKVCLGDVNDLVVVAVNDTLMILPKEQAQRVKEFQSST